MTPSGPATPTAKPTGDGATGAPTVTKAERTRTAIMDAALDLFREKGYDATTMRAIAAAAGVSVGNAYYYFDSKEQLIQGFYDRIQEDHAALARPILDAEADLGRRLAGVATAWIDLVEPYRPFAGKFFKNAAEPTSPLSPFSLESSASREAAVALWREVLEGGDVPLPVALSADLPDLLWVAFMGIVLFWVHDRTPGAAATRGLVDSAMPLLVQGVRLASLPGLEGTVDQVVQLLESIRQSFQAAAAGDVAAQAPETGSNNGTNTSP